MHLTILGSCLREKRKFFRFRMSIVPDLSLGDSSCQKRKVRRWSDPGKIKTNIDVLIKVVLFMTVLSK